ncbi:MAG: Hpt domain-containing protein, partial [Pseudomonadota bacterium]
MTTAQSSAPGWDAPAEGPPEVDPDLVAELVESFGAEFLVELRESACAEAPDQFDDLTKAVAEVDPVAGERALHALKGTASSLGLLAFAEAAEAA